jgi:hypothetical protein
MAKRRRDYAAEYARRKELERQRAQSEGREFSLKKARGHGAIRPSTQRKRITEKIRRMELTRAPWEDEITANDVEDLANEVGWDTVEAGLDEQHEMNLAWLDNDYGRAHGLWQGRNTDLPNWLYHYHGFFD